MQSGSSDAWNMFAVVSLTRRSNSAKPKDLVKVLKAHLPQGLDKKYLDHEPGMLVQAYEDIISDVLLRTSRPTKSLLQSAAVKAWQNVKTSEAETWGSQVAKACELVLQQAASSEHRCEVECCCSQKDHPANQQAEFWCQKD